MTRLRGTGAVLTAAAALVLLAATPAAAENPVLDVEGDAEVASTLAEAQEVQGVCYGYLLEVRDRDTGQFSGAFASSSAGAGQRAAGSPGCDDVVELVASITYTGSLEEAEDSASWRLDSTVGDLAITDVEQATGTDAGGLLDDARSETVLLNALASLPVLASEQAGLPPVIAEQNTEALPADARTTNPPGSDWLRQNGRLLALSGLALLSGLVALAASFRRPRRSAGGPPRTFGPPRTSGPPRDGPYGAAGPYDVAGSGPSSPARDARSALRPPPPQDGPTRPRSDT